MNNWLNIDSPPVNVGRLQTSPRLSGLRSCKNTNQKKKREIYSYIFFSHNYRFWFDRFGVFIPTWVSTARFGTRRLKKHQRTRLPRWGFAPCVIKRVHAEFRDSSELRLDHSLCGKNRKHKLAQDDVLRRVPANHRRPWGTPPKLLTHATFV